MTPDEALDALAEQRGLLAGFRDMQGREIHAGPETKLALLRADGIALDDASMAEEALVALRAGEARRLAPEYAVGAAGRPVTVAIAPGAGWALCAEGSEAVLATGRAQGAVTLPPLAAGYYILSLVRRRETQECLVIIAPPSLPAVGDGGGPARIWGLTAALYGLRSDRNLGIGDFADLADLLGAVRPAGAGFLGINPVHALGWQARETISPYSPSHRGFLGERHIAPDRIPGLEGLEAAARICEAARRGIESGAEADRIDYPASINAHQTALQALWDLFQAEAPVAARERFAAFRRQGGEELERFALYESLSETHGADWRGWPAGLRAPDGPDIAAARRRLGQRSGFFCWLQWAAEEQLALSGRGGRPGEGLYLDLAVGPRRGGAESWCHADAIAQGVSLGAPPDALNPEGQCWDLAAYAPSRLKAERFASFRRILRANLRHAALLRIDHVLGLNRSYWIPDDGSPGGYVRQPLDALLAILSIEANAAGTIVIGEDLGLVPEGFRDTLAQRNIHGCSVLQFERDAKGRFRRPESLRRLSLACAATHDTPTIRGFWEGRDIDWWRKLGWVDASQAAKLQAQRARDTAALAALCAEDAPAQAARDPARCMHGLLARSPAVLVSLQLDDLIGETEAQNLPGTTTEHPNWTRRYPMDVARLGALPELGAFDALMRAQPQPTPRPGKEEALP